MKILVAYDGSQCSEAALDDLSRAGLPPSGDAVLITVAEVWLPPPKNNGNSGTDASVEIAFKKFTDKGKRLLNEAGMLADHAVARLRNILPGWKISKYVTYGSPAWEVITKANDLRPDVIVLGSHGHSSLSRLVLGSVSQKILSESAFSVRVGRGRNELEPVSERIIIGFDGSPGAYSAVEAVARRCWSQPEVELVAATGPVVPSSIGRFLSPVATWADEELKRDYKWITDLAVRACSVLECAGLKAGLRILEGNPRDLLIREAENWHADCIFVGATAQEDLMQRLLLGSTASAIAARAHCSVEVIRE